MTGHTSTASVGQMADLQGIVMAVGLEYPHVSPVVCSFPETVAAASPHPACTDCTVQEPMVLFFKYQVKPKPAKLCSGSWGATIRTTTVRKWPRLESKGPALLAFPGHPGPPQFPHLSAETYGYYLKSFNKLQAACCSTGQCVKAAGEGCLAYLCSICSRPLRICPLC